MSMMKSKPNGEIVEVEGGGRIVRSLRRKDRHSKVCTSKGPRDRRVRLSANTAIQFYDVQDRLGYDRPSKAIDWLMKEAKHVIDALENDHHEHNLLTTVVGSSEAFRRTGGERNNQETSNHVQIKGFDGYQMGVMDSRNEKQENPIGELTQMDFTWNPSYDSGDGFAFGDREPLQSSYPTIVHTFSNEFEDDEAFLGFNFQEENQVDEEEICKLVSKTRSFSESSYQFL